MLPSLGRPEKRPKLGGLHRDATQLSYALLQLGGMPGSTTQLYKASTQLGGVPGNATQLGEAGEAGWVTQGRHPAILSLTAAKWHA